MRKSTRKPRLMSFALTTQQIVDQTKDVTRRLGWGRLKPGDLIQACEKVRGVRKQDRRTLALLEVVSVRKERLNAIDQTDVEREGFPGMSPAEFVAMFCKHMGTFARVKVTRIEFKYLSSSEPNQ